MDSFDGNETESVVYEENIPLSKVAEMIQGGDIELTKAIEMVHQYNLMIQEGKNLDNEDTVVHEEINLSNKSLKLVHEEKESKLYSPRTKKSIEPICRNRICKKDCKHCNGENSIKFRFPCKKCNKSCSNLFNLQRHELTTHAEVKPDIYSCSYCTIKFRHKDSLVKHENNHIEKGQLENKDIAEMVYGSKNQRFNQTEFRRNMFLENEQSWVSKGYVDFCEICRKSVSKYYLKTHMLKMHQIEIIDNGTNQMKEHIEKIQERQDPLTSHELVNKAESIKEVKNPIFEQTESKQEMPKFEEILINPVLIKNDKKWSKCPKCQECFGSVDEYTRHRMQAFYNIDISTCVQNPRNERKNPCLQCAATFKTKRRLSIHIELVHEEKKENIEIPKAKKQKTDKKDLPLLMLPNPSEMLTKRHIFDYIYSLKITPGICDFSDYQNYVMETVLYFNNLTIDKLSESSVQKLKTKARGLTASVYGHWRRSDKHRVGLYKKFQNNMQDPFDWIPELVHLEKNDNFEMPTLTEQKSDMKISKQAFSLGSRTYAKKNYENLLHITQKT